MSKGLDMLDALARPLLVRLTPETAHRLTIMGLSLLPRGAAPHDDPRLAVSAFGIDFPNPLGLAAGFDKNGEVPDAMMRMGLGFTEVGTVTPLPQAGNARPRVFRLEQDHAVINRLGFNSAGHAAVHRRLAQRRGRPGIVALNLGANKDADDRIDDYVAGIKAFADVAQIFVINVSSPNTPGLRELQSAQALGELLSRVLAARDEQSERRPVIVKIAPDLTLDDLDGIVRTCRAHRIDGLSISNTTLARPPGLRDKEMAKAAGGLSGHPLFALSTRLLAQAYLRVENQFPLIGIGGVDDARTAVAKIEAGATLIQFYSGLVFAGPRLIRDVKAGLLARITESRLHHLGAARGVRAQDWADGKIAAADL